MKYTVKWVSLAILIAAAPAAAQTAGSQSGSTSMQGNGMGMQGNGMGMQGGMRMRGTGMRGMMGMHAMAATVTNVDSQSGLMDVDAGGMALKLHFPPSALAGVKPGDKITLHMGFSKP